MTARTYRVRHGQGYSRFEHDGHEIALDLLVYVPLHDSIKISRLIVRNTSQRRRTLSVTAYVEWVLGTARAASAPFVVTEIDAQTGAMFARNSWNMAFGSRVAFADLAGRQTQWTGDRREFLGRHGRLDRPAALATHAATVRSRGSGSRSVLCPASATGSGAGRSRGNRVLARRSGLGRRSTNAARTLSIDRSGCRPARGQRATGTTCWGRFR